MKKFHRRSRVGAVLFLTASLSCLWADEWTEVKDIQGRKLTVKIEKVEDDEVTFSTKNGKSYTYPIDKFSLIDQLNLRQWKPPRTTANPVKEDSELQKVETSDLDSVFRSKHFEFQILGEAEAEQIETMVPVFEAVHWAFFDLPVSLEPKPAESHFKVRLYLTESDFEISSQETLGRDQPAIYNLSKDVLFAPIGRLKPSPALTREIAFSLLGERLTTLPPWLAVSVTEYLAAAPYQDHKLNLEDRLANMLRYLEEVYGLADKTMPMLPPNEVFARDYSTFRAEGLEGNKSRSSALLAFYYFAHLDGKGEGLTNYVRAVQTNTAPDEALGALTRDREPLRLQDDIKVAYVPKQLRIAYIK